MTHGAVFSRFDLTNARIRGIVSIALNNTITWAADVRKAKPAIFRKMIRRAMTTDFSWNRTAGNYERMYEDAHQ